MIGTSLSHYKIVGELGRGGMGIVYKAEDKKLNRMVAIKVLPVAALGNEDDKARFFREAQAAAQLHHANIATVFAIEEATLDGETRPFIAMELVEGETLTERIATGPMKLEDAVRITTQVADALEAAHEKNIVHRDVKSGNVMLTTKGVAKVLDFGLAKTAQSTKLTQLGSTLGTIAYMSPEQARGEEVDRRSDIWSLGVLLYEMISGRLPFASQYEQAAVYSILNEEPEPLTSIRTGVTMGLEWIVSKLLAKNKSDRYQNISDLLIDLRTVDLKASGLSRVSAVAGSSGEGVMAAGGPHSVGRSVAGDAPVRRVSRSASVVGAVGVALGAVIVSIFWLLWPAGVSSGISTSPKHFVQAVPVDGSVIAVDLSPAGDAVAIASSVVQVLDLKTGRMTEYPEAGVAVAVDFSPDGRSLLLTLSAGLSRLSLDNGSIVHIGDTDEGGPRASWMNPDWVVYEERSTIFRRSIVSGEVLRVSTLDSLSREYDQDWPSVLPDGKTLVATSEYRDADSRIGFWDIESGKNLKYLDFPGYRVQYLNPGYLIFEMGGSIMALPFDLKSLSQTGPIRSIAENARAGGLSLSGDGTMVHAGADIGLRLNSAPVVPILVDGAIGGNPSREMDIPPDRYRNLVISPDGKRAAVVVDDASGTEPLSDIWILDLENDTRRVLTQGGNNDSPAWTANGDSVLFVRRERIDRVMAISANGRGAPVPSWLQSRGSTTTDLVRSRDGSVTIWVTTDSQAALSVHTGLGVHFADGRKYLLTSDTSLPRHPSISPDTRFVAYEEYGSIKILALDDLEGIPITAWERDMSLPKWAPDMSELYALAPDGTVQSVDILTEPVLSLVSSPKLEVNWAVAGISLFDVFPSGKRFILPAPTASGDGNVRPDTTRQVADLHFFINLPAELIE